MPSALATSLSVTPHPSSPDTYTSRSLWVPCGARGVFGGQVIAQALSSASSTLPSHLSLHSTHCYFLLPASGAQPIIYRVERLRDGKSYATRLVKGMQGKKVVFVLMGSYSVGGVEGGVKGETPFGFVPTLSVGKAQSEERIKGTAKGKGKEAKGRESDVAVSHSLRFTVEPAGKSREREDGEGIVGVPGFVPRWQVDMPDDILPWEECELEEERWERYIREKGESQGEKGRKAVQEYLQERRESPIAIAVAKRKSGRGEARNTRMTWMKARFDDDERPDQETIKIMIAYMTDFQFIGVAARSVGLTRNSTPRLGMLASLDHTVHYYPIPSDFDGREPLLHVMESSLADVGSGRGVVRGLLYTKQGRLLAVTSQEGVVRADLGRPERGLVEGGGMGEDDKESVNKLQAKL